MGSSNSIDKSEDTNYDLEWLNKNSKTGDLILYQENTWLGRKIEYFTKSKYSHCGIIIRNDNKLISDKFKIYDDAVYFFNSTGLLNISDLLTNRTKVFGVQLNRMTDVIAVQFKEDPTLNYFYRPCNYNRDDTFYNNLCATVDLTIGKVYDVHPSDWISAMIFERLTAAGKTADNAEKIIKKYDPFVEFTATKRFYCSAFVAYILYNLSLISIDTKWTVITPNEFAQDSNNSEAIVWTSPNIYGQQIKLQL